MIHPKKRPKGGLTIHQSKEKGVYVKGLNEIIVNSYEDIEEQINNGTAHRTIGATNMNATSS
jgi:hypothetical protein